MKRLLFAFLALSQMPYSLNASVDPKIAEICMKAVDFQGCVNALGGQTNSPIKTTVVSNKQNELLLEIKKLPSRLQNTSLRDYTSRTLSFTDALAVSSPEEVGVNLYENAQKISKALDVLYEVWRRDIEIGNEYETGYHWDPSKNLATKTSLDSIFGGNTIEIRCNKRWFGLLGGGTRRIGENILVPVSKVVSYAAEQISSPEDVITFPQHSQKSFIKSSAPEFCPGDPNEPKEEVKEAAPDKPKTPVKINCKSPVWKKKPICN